MPEYNDVDLRSFYDDPDSDLIEFDNELARQVKDVIGCEDDEPEEVSDGNRIAKLCIATVAIGWWP